MIRLAIVYSIPTPYRIPFFEKLAKQKEINLTVFFMGATAHNRRWSKLGRYRFNHIFLPGLNFSFGSKDIYPIWLNPTIPIKLYQGKFDVVVNIGWDSLTNWLTLLVCKALGIPFVLWSGSTEYEPSWRRTITQPLVQLIVALSAGFIAYGTRSKEYLIKLGASPERIAIVYNTIDVLALQKAVMMAKGKAVKLRKKFNLENKKVILYVGQIIERKGARNLLEVFRRVKKTNSEVALLLVGYGQQEESLKSLVRKEQVTDVVFAGFQEAEGLASFYSLANLFVLPAKEEIWGLVVNEAMAAGLPVITTDRVGAGADLVTDGENGYVVPAKDSRALEEAIKKALQPKKMAQLKDGSLKAIQEFTLEKVIPPFVEAVRRAR